MKPLFTSLALACLTFSSAGAHAQAGAGEGAAPKLLEPPRHRQGYYIAFGLHALVNQNWDHGEAVGVGSGSAFTLRMGQLLTRRFGLGLQIDSGAAMREQETATIFGLSMAAQWELARNLAAHGGVGLGVVSLSDANDPDAPLRGVVGAGYFLGLSYDWFPRKKRLTGGFAITPLAQLRVIPGETVDSLVALVGIELGWWTGLPHNQLELPESEAYKRR
jgi:hypothetical protein